MEIMTKKKIKKPAYPSRENVKYTSLPLNLWQILDAMAKAEERSVAYYVRRYVQDGLRRDGKLEQQSG